MQLIIGAGVHVLEKVWGPRVSAMATEGGRMRRVQAENREVGVTTKKNKVRKLSGF
jgi:hypothetical protein